MHLIIYLHIVPRNALHQLLKFRKIKVASAQKQGDIALGPVVSKLGGSKLSLVL